MAHETSPTATGRPVNRGGRPRDASIDATLREATVDLVLRDGIGAVSIEAVAAATGIAKTTIYRRWTCIRDLLLDALTHLKEEQDLPSLDGPLEQVLIERMWSLNWRMGHSRAGRLVIELLPDSHRNPDRFWAYWNTFVRPRNLAISERLEQAVADGELTAGLDLSFVPEMLAGPVLAATISRPGSLTREQVEFHVRTILRGLRP